MFDRSFQPKGAKRPPKWSPEMPKSAKSLKKVGKNSSLEIGPEKRKSKAWESYSRQRSGSSFEVPRPSKKHAKWTPNGTQNWQTVKKNQKNGNRKNMKTNCQEVGKSTKWHQNGVPGGGHREVRKSSIMKFSEISQNDSHGCPGLEKAPQRHPKGVQKAPERGPESFKMTSKRRPQGIRIR